MPPAVSSTNNDDDDHTSNTTPLLSLIFLELAEPLAPAVLAGNNKAAFWGLCSQIEQLENFACVHWGVVQAGRSGIGGDGRRVVVLVGLYPSAARSARPRAEKKDVDSNVDVDETKKTSTTGEEDLFNRIRPFCAHEPAVFRLRFPCDITRLYTSREVSLTFAFRSPSWCGEIISPITIDGMVTAVAFNYPDRALGGESSSSQKRAPHQATAPAWQRWWFAPRTVQPVNFDPADVKRTLGIAVEMQCINVPGGSDFEARWLKQWCQRHTHATYFPDGICEKEEVRRQHATLPEAVVGEQKEESGKAVDVDEDDYSMVEKDELDVI